jgi:hypothetical protein
MSAKQSLGQRGRTYRPITTLLFWSCAMGALGAIAVGFPSTALAGDIPGNRSTRAVLKIGPAGVNGVFERRGDSDWYRVRLRGGRNYAVHNGPNFEGCSLLNLRNAKGKVIGTDSGGGPAFDGGFEFRPARDGTFFVELKDRVCPEPSYPSDYHAHVTADARGDPTTDATIKVGQTVEGRFHWGTDTDFFRTTLQVGTSYTATLDSSLEHNLGLVDSQGTVLFDEFMPGPRMFTVPASGTYYLVAACNDDNAFNRYTLSLTTP